MKEIYIAKFKTDEQLTDFFMVKSITIKTGSNQKQFLDLILGDNSGDISAKKWDIADTELESLNEIKTGDIVKVKAVVTEWNGMKQLKITKLRKAVEQDDINKGDFIKAAPEDPVDMFDYIYEKAKSISKPEFSKLCVMILDDRKEKLMYYPAAAKNHHAEMAGLLYHMKRMLMMAEKCCEVYTNLDRNLLVTGVILHEIEKLEEMNSDENGIVSEYSYEGVMLGHLIQGIKVIDRYAEKIGISDEETIMLEHMILSHHYEPEFGSPKRPLFPEAEILHYLDKVDAAMYDMEEALFGVEPGDFSDRVWTLDNRKLYKRK